MKTDLEQDADMLTGDEQVWKEVQESLKKIEELKAHWKWEQVLAMCQSIISSNAERLPDINIYQLKVLDCAMDACINLGLLEEALFYGIRTMEPYRKRLGPHPDLLNMPTSLVGGERKQYDVLVWEPAGRVSARYPGTVTHSALPWACSAVPSRLRVTQTL
uniref:Uncharacterized protein n=1 Tax=Capra hircus TaxID=9925 RepID=A0A8C2RCV2_CAPHI